jgi:hypothetical protein
VDRGKQLTAATAFVFDQTGFALKLFSKSLKTKLSAWGNALNYKFRAYTRTLSYSS